MVRFFIDRVDEAAGNNDNQHQKNLGELRRLALLAVLPAWVARGGDVAIAASAAVTAHACYPFRTYPYPY